MRKIYMMLTALLASFAITANAERVLYQETYEAGGVPSTWICDGGTLSVVSTEQSSLLNFALGSNNGRTSRDFWGSNIFEGVTNEEYSMSFEFQFTKVNSGNSKDQFNGEIAVFSDDKADYMKNGSLGGAQKDWGLYATRTNCLFSIAQIDATTWKINNEESKIFTPNVGATGTWYYITLNVNTKTKEVAYKIFDYDQSKAVATGVKTMSDDAQMYATGLYLMASRYQTTYTLDNIKVFLDIDWANKPVVALTGLNMAERTYTVTFLEGETLHFIGTDGEEKTISYDDVEEGNYIYTTSNSGTIRAWTTAGSMKSEEVSTEVDCSPITIPEPVSAIVSASEGYGKTYQFTIDNASITLQPTVFMDFTFESADGKSNFTLNDQNNGVKVNIPAKGKLTIKTKAKGYAEGTYTMMNDQEFELKHDINFQKYTAEDLTAMGFQAMDDLDTEATSGESNWTGRKRLYLDIKTGEKDGEGNELTTRHLVYGPTQVTNAEKQKIDTGAEPIKRMQLLQSKLEEGNAYKTMFAPLYIWHGTEGVKSPSTHFDITYEEDGTTIKSVTPKTDANGNPAGSSNPKMYIGLGLCYSGSLGDAGAYDPLKAGYGNIILENAPIGVDGLTDQDFIVVSTISDYGTGSIHPVYEAGTTVEAAKADYKSQTIGTSTAVYKGTETFTFHRVDEALNRVVVLTPKSGSTGIETVNNYGKMVSDHNAPVYNLNGVQVNPNALTKGIYIKQGKKFIVR